MLRLSDL
jgi:hypothetical protein